MDKIALVFPGQGSQYVGMGREFYEKYSAAREIFDRAHNILGYDIKKIIFEGPMDLLTQTINTQPAVFITSVACFEVLAATYPSLTTHCSFAAGHSLGEYSALCVAGFLSFENTLKLVQKRAQFIEEACHKNKGTMVALLGDEMTLKNNVEEICSEAKKVGICEAVNFNTPQQIIISGEISAIEKAKEIAKIKKVKAIPLSVSGAFHSTLMNDAASRMSEEVNKYISAFGTPRFPVVTNCDAQITTDASSLAKKLPRQINSPVLWDISIRKIIEEGVSTFIELGPKNTLCGMIKKISPEAKTYNIENEETLKSFSEAIKNV